MELLSVNKRPTHASDHALDLVLLLCDSRVDNLNMLPISFSLFDHDMVFFHVNLPKTYSFTKSIAWKKYQRVADTSHFRSSE